MAKTSRPKKLNEIIVEGDIAKIICYRKGEAYEVLIDAEDVDKVKDYTWNVHSKRLYCYTLLNKSNTGLHRYIMNAPEGMVVDHINGDTLDNRKCNLRICTQQENLMNRPKPKNNTSGRKGVYWDKTYNKWKVCIKINGKQKHLAYFDNKEDAVKLREEAEAKYFGEYARKE